MKRRALLTTLAALALALGACSGTPRTSDQAVLGPYVQWVTQDSARVCWATSTGAVKVAGGGRRAAARAYIHHEMVIDQLSPGTTYTYQVPGLADGSGSFTTVAEGDEPFTFAVIGDTRTGHETHQKLVNMIIGQKPAFAVNTGDLVAHGLRTEEWETFFKINRELMRNTPYYPALGNHEEDASFYFQAFVLPGNERYYSLDQGGVHFVFLDNYGPSLHGVDTTKEPGKSRQERVTEDFWREQLAWLRADLAAHQDAGFRIVFMHQGPWTAKESRLADAAAVRARLGSVLDDGRVDAVITGHDHYYLRLENKGITYVTCAGGGAPLYDPTAPLAEVDHVHKRVKVHHYMLAEVDKAVIKFTATNVDGEVIDTFELHARKAEANP